MASQKTKQQQENFHIFPIGYIKRAKGKTYIHVLKNNLPALKHLEQFSHVQVFWWCNEYQTTDRPTFTHTKSKNSKNVPDTGIFASRSIMRPNPIGLTSVRIITIDHTHGHIEIANIDAYDNTPVIDLKAYMPVADRVKEIRVPEWLAQWPEWMTENGLDLKDGEKDIRMPELTQEAEEFRIFPVGSIHKKRGKTSLQIHEEFSPALECLEQFSHVQILWWFHRFDTSRFRRTLQCNPPYENAPRTGVFASRSPVRPNPIALSTATILNVDPHKGIVEIADIDAFDKTPIIDLKAYIPCYDRVKTINMPQWLVHWPQWRPEADEYEIISPENLRPADSERLAILGSLPDSQTSLPTPEDLANSAARSRFNTPEPTPVDPHNIIIRGARQHNLKNIDITIPRFKFVVVTGVSGSGKSSLAFDTIYAEGQRRYMDSLSARARSLVQFEKPAVDHIIGLNPTIAIEQKTVSRNPRSTVGTLTDIYTYLRLLFSRIGTRHCTQCGRAIRPQTARQMADQLAILPAGTWFQLAGPTQAAALAKELTIPKEVTAEFRKHLLETVNTLLEANNGELIVLLENGKELLLSSHNACPYCQNIVFDLHSSFFSFNSPDGMCPNCNGLGVKLQVEPELIVTQPELSLFDGASPWFGELRKVKPSGNWMRSELFALVDLRGVDLELPWNQLPQKFREEVLYGTGDEILNWTYDMKKRGRSISFERPAQGAVNNIKRLLQQTDSELARRHLLRFLSERPCDTCQGERLCPEARFVTIGVKRYPEVAHMTIAQAYAWVQDLPQTLSADQLVIAEEILGELHNRLRFLLNVGLHYLTLDRSAPTLSGGEGQRLRLATQLGGGLSGLFYVLDEPSIGLHPRNHQPLLETLLHLRDTGNTILVVEHDADTMRAADWLIDLGPGAGVLGGEMVAAGTPQDVMANPESLTGRYLSGQLAVTHPNGSRRQQPQNWITISGARLHNLKNIEVRFPLGVLTCVTR